MLQTTTYTISILLSPDSILPPPDGLPAGNAHLSGSRAVTRPTPWTPSRPEVVLALQKRWVGRQRALGRLLPASQRCSPARLYSLPYVSADSAAPPAVATDGQPMCMEACYHLLLTPTRPEAYGCYSHMCASRTRHPGVHER